MLLRKDRHQIPDQDQVDVTGKHFWMFLWLTAHTYNKKNNSDSPNLIVGSFIYKTMTLIFEELLIFNKRSRNWCSANTLRYGLWHSTTKQYLDIFNSCIASSKLKISCWQTVPRPSFCEGLLCSGHTLGCVVGVFCLPRLIDRGL